MSLNNERELKKVFCFLVFLVYTFILILILSGMIISLDPSDDLKKKAQIEEQISKFNSLSSDQQSAMWRDFVNIHDKSVQDSLWNTVSFEKQKEILDKISSGKFSYLNDFLGLSENVKKSVLKSHMDSMINLFSQNDASVFNKEEILSKYSTECLDGFNEIFKKSDDRAKLDVAKLFSGEEDKSTGLKNGFLTNSQKEDLFNKFDIKTKEGLLIKMSEVSFKDRGTFPNGKKPKIESITLDNTAKYNWVGNKLGIDDGKGNLKAWIDFDSLPPQTKNIKYEKGIFEMSFNAGRTVTFNSGSINSDGKPVRPNGKLLGGAKREFSLLNGIISGNDKSQIDIRYDDSGFAKLTLSGNSEQTVLAAKDSMGNDFWFSQFHQDSKNEKGELVKDTQAAEIEVAPNDDLRAKNAIVHGSFGRKITSKTGFTELGSTGLLGGDKWSNDQVKEKIGDVAKTVGTTIGSISNAISALTSRGSSAPSSENTKDWVPKLEADTPSTSTQTPSGYPSSSTVGFADKSDRDGFFNVEYGKKGLKLTDEGKGYGVLDITKSALPIEEVRIKSESVVSDEKDVSGRAVDQHYLIDGGAVFRFGKEQTYVERSFENAKFPINAIVNENLKGPDGKNYNLVLDNSQGRFELYVDQRTPGLSDESKVTDVTTATTTLQIWAEPKSAKERFGTRKGAGTVYGDLLEVQISSPAGPGQASPDVEISTLDPSSAALGLLNPGLQRRRGPLARGARDQALSTATEQISSGLATNDPAEKVLGEAQATIEAQVNSYAQAAGGKEQLQAWAKSLLAASDNGYEVKVAGTTIYKTNPLNLNAEQKEGLNFLINYDSEMQKLSEFRKQATLSQLGNSYLNIRSSTGTFESNGATLSSPFLAKQVAREISTDQGISRFNMITNKNQDQIQKSPSAVSRVRVYGSKTSSSQSNAQSNVCNSGGCSSCGSSECGN